MGWISEVLVERGTEWARNAVVWPDKDSALSAGAELLSRWFVPTDYRATEVNETPNRPTWSVYIGKDAK